MTMQFQGSGAVRSLAVGMSLFLAAACTITTKESDDDDDDAGADSGGTSSAQAGNGGSSGSSYAGNGGSAGSTAGNGGSAGDTAYAGNSGTNEGGNGADAGGEGGADAGGEGGAGPTDNCPDDASTDQTDTDEDGRGDVCDEDDDEDGFVDADDPQPKDPDVPGDFSTPEKVLEDPRVKAALEGLREAGHELPTHLEDDPPAVTGYFRKEDGDGSFVANSGGGGVGQSIVGNESRFELDERDRLDSVSVSFTSGMATGFSTVSGQILRGTGNDYTIYRTTRNVCTEGGANYTTFTVGISSGTVDPTTGDLTDVLSLGVTIATAGEVTSACASRLNGLIENEGEWTATQVPLIAKVAVSALEFMCVDGDDAFIPNETWTNDDDEPCECTTEFEVACAVPAPLQYTCRLPAR